MRHRYGCVTFHNAESAELAVQAKEEDLILDGRCVCVYVCVGIRCVYVYMYVWRVYLHALFVSSNQNCMSSDIRYLNF